MYTIDNIYLDDNLKFYPYPYCPKCNDILTIDKTKIICHSCASVEVDAKNIKHLIYKWNQYCEDVLYDKFYERSMLGFVIFGIIMIVIGCILNYTMLVLSTIFISPIILLLFLSLGRLKIRNNIYKTIKLYKENINNISSENLTLDMLIKRLNIHSYKQINIIVDILRQIKNYNNKYLNKHILNDSINLLNALDVPNKLNEKNKIILNEILDYYINIYNRYLARIKENSNDNISIKLKAILMDVKTK